MRCYIRGSPTPPPDDTEDRWPRTRAVLQLRQEELGCTNVTVIITRVIPTYVVGR